jgi:hypothetical protein
MNDEPKKNRTRHYEKQTTEGIRKMKVKKKQLKIIRKEYGFY